eukprot:Selendium_serpulae@DN2275_c0_g1_i2.p1
MVFHLFEEDHCQIFIIQNRNSRGYTYFNVRGEIPGLLKDELHRLSISSDKPPPAPTAPTDKENRIPKKYVEETLRFLKTHHNVAHLYERRSLRRPKDLPTFVSGCYLPYAAH